MKEITKLLIILNLIYLSFSIVPLWDFESSTINLLNSSNNFKYQYDITKRTVHDNLWFILTKTMEKGSNEATITNRLTLEYLNRHPVEEIVNFEEIETAYTDKSERYFICPKGCHHLLYNYSPDGVSLKELIPDNFVNDSDWELNCYYQYNQKDLKKLFIFYLNKEEYIYTINDITSPKITPVGNTKYKILSYRWTDIISNGVYPMYAVIAFQNQARFVKLDFNIVSSSSVETKISQSGNIDLFTIPKSNFKGFFNDIIKNTKFYYISYDNDSINLTSGYSIDLGEINSIDNFKNSYMTHNDKSPFEFFDKVIIKEINFIPYTKYVYYKLYNEDKKINYYGIVDIEQNKVIYNTDETIIKFTPFNSHSMLVTTSKSAYQICSIYKDKNCVDSCSYNVLYDIEQNSQCINSDKCNIYKLIPNNICIPDCDINYFYLDNNNQCGLCKDFTFGKPFKVINNTGCIESKLNNSYYVNQELQLISCNEKYSYINGKCEYNCYERCDTCLEKSYNITDQKCSSCKSSFPILYQNNCINKCPEKTYQKDNTCEECNELCVTCNEKGCLNCYPGYYLNNNTHTCDQCHQKCETCLGKGDDINNNCIKCKNQNDVLFNGTCLESCGEKYYKTSNNQCEPCKTECHSCDNEVECTKCINGYFLDNKLCYSCHETCATCLIGGDENNNNCSSCKNDLYFIKEGEYVNNCVRDCPSGTVKDDKEKICKIKNKEENDEINEESSNKDYDFLIWIFVVGAGFLFVLINIIFFLRTCCCKGNENDEIEKINTVLSEMNLVIK